MVKRVLTSIITVAVLMGVLVACSGSDSANNSGQSELDAAYERKAQEAQAPTPTPTPTPDPNLVAEEKARIWVRDIYAAETEQIWDMFDITSISTTYWVETCLLPIYELTSSPGEKNFWQETKENLIDNSQAELLLPDLNEEQVRAVKDCSADVLAPQEFIRMYS